MNSNLAFKEILVSKYTESFDKYSVSYPSIDYNNFSNSSPKKNSYIQSYPYLVLLSLILADGLLTYLGVVNYGSEVEGNFYLKNLMDTLGINSALVLVKVMSVILLFLIWTVRIE